MDDSFNPFAEGNGVIFAGALTKSVVMTLPDDAWILSNVSNGDGSPVFVGAAGQVAKRSKLWDRLRELRVNGRRVYIFRDADTCAAFCKRRELLHEASQRA